MPVELTSFWQRRQEAQLLFDEIQCPAWQTVLEKNGLAEVKNLVLPQCYLFLKQVPAVKSGELCQKLERVISVLTEHFAKCATCQIELRMCEVCFGSKGETFYRHERRKGHECGQCGILAHNECLS